MSRAPGRHVLDDVLRPRAVAVVGASADPRKRGYHALRALQASAFPGAVYPVNPRGGEVRGLTVYPSLDDLPGPVDLALVCTPAATGPEVVAACGRAGIPAAVLLAVGFRESGAEGARLEADLAEAARRHGVRLVGPNTSGLMNLSAGLNLIGVRDVRAGGLGLLVQSGNLALNLMLDAARRSRAGLSIAVGVGNEVDLGFADFIEGLADDPATRAILVHAEGFRRGPEALDAAARAARVKPVVLLKGARTAEAGEAARSHSGAVAGRYPALRAALRQAGVIEVTRSDELFHVGETLAGQPAAARGTGVAILSDGGGQGTLAVDRLMESGTAPVTLQPATRARLRELLGPAAAVGNPVDLAGAADGDPERFARAIEVLVTDPDVGVVLVVGLFGGYALRFDESLAGSEVRAAGAMAAGARAAGVGLVVHTMYAPEPTPSLAVLRDEGVPVVESLEVACRCASALVERGQALARAPWRPSGAGERTRATGTAVRALSEPEARARLGAAGVPLVPAWACADEEAAVEAAAACAGPVVLKVLADGVVHKSDAGGVRLDVRGEAAVREAFADVTRAARTYRSQAGAGQREREEGVRGVLVSPHLPPPVAEILAGVHLDPQVGAVLTLGAGGIWVESLADVALRALPVGSADIRAMLAELRLAPVLGGARGRPGADLGALVEAVAALARLIERDPEVTEAEVNPLFAYPDRCVAVDARVYVACPSDADAVPCPSHA